MPVVKPSEPVRPATAPPAPEARPEGLAPIVEESKPATGLAPELRAAFEASWSRHESAYRYLGR